MSEPQPPIAIGAADVPPRATTSFYPEPFASRMAGRQKRQLGEFFGLKNFGVNLTRLPPGGVSSLRHSHAKQDEFVYAVSGQPTLHTDRGPRTAGSRHVRRIQGRDGRRPSSAQRTPPRRSSTSRSAIEPRASR